MNALEIAVKSALENEGASKEANKAYLEFIKANFIIPIKKDGNSTEPEVLFIEEQGTFLLPVFSSQAYFDQWAQDISSEINLLKLSGVDLLKGIGEQVTVCLNIGSAIYKEFNTAEIARMKGMVLKLFK